MKLITAKAVTHLLGVRAEIPTGGCAWVDSVNGDDATACLGRLDMPFRTLTKARDVAAAAATSTTPITILVLPGTYENQTDLLRNNVHWHFMPGTKVFVNNPALAEIFVAATTIKAMVTGWGEFEDTAGGTRAILHVTGSGCAIDFECASMTCGQCVSIIATTGRVFIEAKQGLNAAYIAISQSAGASFLSRLVSPNIYGSVLCDGGQMRVCAGRIEHQESSALIVCTDTADMLVDAREINLGGSYGNAISYCLGKLSVYGAEIHAPEFAVYLDLVPSTGAVSLIGCRAFAGEDTSINDIASEAWLSGRWLSNKDVGDNVEFTDGVYIYS